MSQSTEEIWFSGPVVDAVGQATARNLLFVACIVDDTASSELAMFDKNYVKQILKTHCLCVKLVRGSSEEVMFSQLFPSTQTPSIYIVRSNADKVLLSGEDISEQRIVAEIESRVSSVASVPAQVQELSQPQVAQVPVQQQEPQVPAHLRPIVPVQPSAHSSPSPQPQKQPTQDPEKLAEAKHIEEYRKRLAKEKRADAAYRKAVLESIKQDRDDFKAIHDAPVAAPRSRDATTKQPADTLGKTKILFRISDGRTEFGEFDVQAEFAEVRSFVEGIEGIPKGQLGIAEAFPRRTLGNDVDEKKLSELGLVPTATLLVNVSGRRVKDGEAFKEPVTWAAFFYSIFASIFGFFASLLPGRISEDERNTTYNREEGAAAHTTARKEMTSPAKKLTHRKKARSGSQSDDDDDDEKRKTYNGNSTNLE